MEVHWGDKKQGIVIYFVKGMVYFYNSPSMEKPCYRIEIMCVQLPKRHGVFEENVFNIPNFKKVRCIF